MPFNVFHEAIESVLARPVFTHEFGANHDGLIEELLHGGESPSLEDVIRMLGPKIKLCL